MINRCLFSFATCILIATNVSAQKLSVESKNVKLAYQAYKKHPKDKSYQLAYVNAFPANATSFKLIFAPNDFKQLSDGHDYIDDFINLSKYFTEKVLDKAIDIGKDLTWDADAINFLQDGIIEMANRWPQLFITRIKILSPRELTKFITYLADVESMHYPEYDKLVSELKKDGDFEIATQFVKIRLRRVKSEETH